MKGIAPRDHVRRAGRAALMLCLLGACAAHAQVSVQPPSLPPGLLGSSYGTVETEGGGLRMTPQIFTASGGTAPYTFKVSAGNLPPGVSLNANGALQGVPSAPGSFSFTVQATDANQLSGTAQASITVAGRAQLGLSGRLGTPFKYQRLCGLDAAAQATFSYAINGNPPPGIGFDAKTSTFAGTPAQEGSYVVIWACASQATGLTFSFEMVFVIGGPVRVTLNPAIVGQPWSFTPSKLTPGQPPYSFAIEGELPRGLALTSTALGTISGVPDQSGTFSWSLRRADAAGSELLVFYDLRVNELTGFSPSLSAWNIVRQAGTPPVSVDVYLNANPSPMPFALAVESEGGSWLSAAPPSGEAPARLVLTADVSGLEPGVYQGKVTVAPPDGGGAAPVEIPVNLEVQPSGPARLRFSRTSVEMSSGSRNSVVVTNVGGDTARGLAVEVRSVNGWLNSATLSREELKPGESLVLELESGSVSFPPGNYAGFARISAANISSVSLPATLKIKPLGYCYFEPAIISRKTHWSGHSGPLTATSRLVFPNADETTGKQTWKMHQLSWLGVVINPQLPSWLRISPMEGSGTTNIQITIDPVGFGTDLMVGEHLLGESFGVKGCVNDLEIRLKVTGADEPVILSDGSIFPMTYLPDNPKLPVDPLSLEFVPVNPEWVDFGITFDRDMFSLQAMGYFEVTPREGRITDAPVKVQVQSLATTPATPMSPSPYRPTFILEFHKLDRRIATKFLTYTHWVLPFPGPGRAAGGGKGLRAAEGGACRPEKLDVSIGLPAPLSLDVGQPQELTVAVVDSCGGLVTEGAVEADFSTGEAPVALAHAGEGRWRGVWIPRVEAEAVSIRVRALAGGLEGEATTGASVLDSSALPVLSGPGAARNAASELAQGVITPGMRIVIRGRRLAVSQEDLDPRREPAETLGGARVLFGDVTLPLLAANENQLLALVPHGAELPAEAKLAVATERGVSDGLGLLSVAAAPGIYSLDGSGSGQGLVYWINAEGQRILADGKNPAPPGAPMVLIATGLGGVRRNPESPGEAALLTIGGVETEPVEVAPREGRPGNYDVFFRLPAGVGAGLTTPVSLSAAGVASRTVTFAVQ